MRLTCPNCDAQYVVPAAAIPADGRDVQCSNCGHIWFTTRETDDAALTEAPRVVPKPTTDTADTPPEPRRAPPNKELRDEVKNVLQQEAQRELMARQAEAKPSFVVQEELGLSGAIDQADLEPTPAQEAVPDLPETVRPEPSKRDRLPDIEDVDRQVDKDVDLPPRPERPEPIQAAAVQETAPKTRWGFHLGFWTAILLLALAVCLYIYADDIRARMPQLSEFLDIYVPWVDSMRDWLTATAGSVENWFRENFNGFQNANE